MPSRKASRTVKQRLGDILASVDEIRAFLDGLTYDDFAADRRTFHAVVRCLEIISEASRHLPSSFKARHVEIDWSRIADAGNVYRHAYDAVTPRRIWDTATIHLDAMRPLIAAEIAKIEAQ
jgi:uncharacterized protein with HEPN domain